MARIIGDYGGLLLRAMGQTLLLTLLSLFFAMIIGMIFALMNVGREPGIESVSGPFMLMRCRGVPLIVLAYFIYFGVPCRHDKRWGSTDFRLQCAPGGYDRSCDELRCLYGRDHPCRYSRVWTKDRWRRAGASDFPMQKVCGCVILPQAIRTMIPSIINQFIITLKDTSILSVIGFPELTNMGKTIVGNTFMNLQTWAIVGIMYMIVIVTLSKLVEDESRGGSNRGR